MPVDTITAVHIYIYIRDQIIIDLFSPHVFVSPTRCQARKERISSPHRRTGDAVPLIQGLVDCKKM